MKNDENIKEIWQAVKTVLKDAFPAFAYDLWVPALELSEIDDRRATLLCQGDTKYKIIKNRHRETISNAFETVLGYPIDVDIVLLQNDSKKTDGASQSRAFDERRVPVYETMADNAQATESQSENTVYHGEYTFDNFIVGGSNKFAHAACVAVANNPGEVYNPLFIYGQSGLGKTHLMYAVANEVRRHDPKKKIIYVTCEEFTNELIEALAKKNPMVNSALREKYRHADVLLIDDVQFIGGKESTQEEFFHTFNELFESHKQIIFTSDRPPKEINRLEDRLKTRFEWGLLADIQPPDMELRSAIIMKKAEAVGLSLSPEVVRYLSDKLKSNIRQIEGSLKRLGAMSFLSGEEITPEMAARCLSDIVSEELPLPVKIARILHEVSDKYGVDEADIRSKKRTADIAWARHVAVYILRKKTDMSLEDIGAEIGRDHSTVLSSYKNIEREIETNPPFAAEINELLNEIDI